MFRQNSKVPPAGQEESTHCVTIPTWTCSLENHGKTNVYCLSIPVCGVLMNFNHFLYCVLCKVISCDRLMSSCIFAHVSYIYIYFSSPILDQARFFSKIMGLVSLSIALKKSEQFHFTLKRSPLIICLDNHEIFFLSLSFMSFAILSLHMAPVSFWNFLQLQFYVHASLHLNLGEFLYKIVMNQKNIHLTMLFHNLCPSSAFSCSSSLILIFSCSFLLYCNHVYIYCMYVCVCEWCVLVVIVSCNFLIFSGG